MDDRPRVSAPIVGRAARIAFAFLVMNYSAVVGLVAFLRGTKVWREQ